MSVEKSSFAIGSNRKEPSMNSEFEKQLSQLFSRLRAEDEQRVSPFERIATPRTPAPSWLWPAMVSACALTLALTGIALWPPAVQITRPAAPDSVDVFRES